MKISKPRLLLMAAVLTAAACGIKAQPIPKDSLKIPYPVNVGLALQDDGVLVTNGEDNYTVLVEKSVNEDTLFSNRMFKRVSMVNPESVYLDKDVKEGLTYTYRFRNYNAQYNTYSVPTVRTIKYFAPVKLGEVKIEQHISSACVSTRLNSVTEYAVVSVNGHEAGHIGENGSACFDLPNSLVVSIIVIPYDYNGNAGTPYETTLKRDEALVLLPPQNVMALRERNRIVLTWDKAANVDGYSVYINDGGSVRPLAKTDITLYQYDLSGNLGCVDFELSSERNGKESDRVKVTSCP